MPFTARRALKRRKQSTIKKKIKFHNYQKGGVKFILNQEQRAAGLFMAPGLGKTLVTLEVAKRLFAAGEIDKILIIAKLRICYLVWPKEIKKWGYNFTCSVLQGTKKDKIFEDDSDIHLINYENVRWLKTKLKGKHRLKYAMCVLDESSKIKNHGAKRSKMLHFMAPQFRWRLILTGSPTPKSLIDIFSQVKFLDYGERLGRYITKFRNRYFYPTGYMGFKWAPFDDTEEEISNKLKDIIFRVSHKQAGIELPKENAVIRRVVLPPKARKIYDALEKDYIADIESKVITAANAAVASGKLRQVANGGIYDEDKKELHIHDEKTEELIEIIEESQGSPVLVAYWFKHDLHRILKAFPNTPYIGAGVSASESIKIEREWNEGKYTLLAGQPASIAHGLNLQDGGCYTIVFYGMPDNLEDYEQLIQRVLRQGNKSDFVTVIHIIADNTVDEDVVVNLYKKDKTQQTFLNSLEKRLNVKIATSRSTTTMNKFEILMKHIPEPLGPVFSRRKLDMNFLDKAGDVTFVHNFVQGFRDRLCAFLPKHHAAFLKDMGVKKLKDDVELRKLYERSSLMVLEILGASISGEGFYVLNDVQTMNTILTMYKGHNPMVKESRIATTGETYDGEVVKNDLPKKKRDAKSKKHFDDQVTAGKEKANVKPATKKKMKKLVKKLEKSAAKVSKKKVDAKKVVKKVVKKKVDAKKSLLVFKPKNNVKVTSDEFPKAVFRADVLRVIRRTRTKKVGYLLDAIQNKLGCTELKAYQAMEGLRDKGFIAFK